MQWKQKRLNCCQQDNYIIDVLVYETAFSVL